MQEQNFNDKSANDGGAVSFRKRNVIFVKKI